MSEEEEDGYQKALRELDGVLDDWNRMKEGVSPEDRAEYYENLSVSSIKKVLELNDTIAKMKRDLELFEEDNHQWQMKNQRLRRKIKEKELDVQKAHKLIFDLRETLSRMRQGASWISDSDSSSEESSPRRHEQVQPSLKAGARLWSYRL